MNAPARLARRKRRSLLRVGAALPWAALLPPAHARAAEATPQQLKAAYLLKFPDFVEWPSRVFSAGGSPFVIAVAGADDVYAELWLLAPAHPVQGRRVEVLRLRRPEPETPTHLVFVGNDQAAQIPGWAAAYAGLPVIVVADAPGALESGAALNFVEVGDRLRFEASPGAAERAGLRLSSRLLGVAERVVRGPSP